MFIRMMGFPNSSIGKESACMQETSIWFLSQEDPLERDRLPTPVFLGFPYGLVGKESWNAGDLGLIPGLGRSQEKGSHGEGKGYLLQDSGLENSMDWSPWGCKD